MKNKMLSQSVADNILSMITIYASTDAHSVPGYLQGSCIIHTKQQSYRRYGYRPPDDYGIFRTEERRRCEKRYKNTHYARDKRTGYPVARTANSKSPIHYT